MPFALEQLSQALSIQDKIDPVSQAAGTVNGNAVDMSKFQRVMAVVQVGSVGASGTVTAQLQSCSASSFASGVNNVTAVSTTVNANNKVLTLECRADQLTPGDRYVRVQVVVGTNAVLISAVVLGGEAEYKPASRQDIAAVVQRLVA
jgi:hypothetical protein